MKNKVFAFKDAVAFENDLNLFSTWCKEHGSPTVCFQIHSAVLDSYKLKPVWNILEHVFPQAPWFGSSTGGNIADCEMATDISVSAIIFEKPTTKFRFLNMTFLKHPSATLQAKS